MRNHILKITNFLLRLLLSATTFKLKWSFLNISPSKLIAQMDIHEMLNAEFTRAESVFANINKDQLSGRIDFAKNKN